MTIEAPVLFGVYTNLTLFFMFAFTFAVTLLTQICIFPIMHSPSFSFCFSFVSYD